jgi:hypothetical protein
MSVARDRAFRNFVASGKVDSKVIQVTTAPPPGSHILSYILLLSALVTPRLLTLLPLAHLAMSLIAPTQMDYQWPVDEDARQSDTACLTEKPLFSLGLSGFCTSLTTTLPPNVLERELFNEMQGMQLRP